MILTGQAIRTEWAAGRIDIRPFKDSQINPNSYNFCLGRELKVYKETLLDARYSNDMHSVTIDDGGYVLRPGRIYLGHTAEIMGSDHYVPIIRGRSSIARLGLFVPHYLELIDIEFRTIVDFATIAFLLSSLSGDGDWPSSTQDSAGEIQLYDGKYQNRVDSAESRLHLDFEDAANSEWSEWERSR